jgi:streptomycin 3"-adenylyltransferase
MTGVVMSDLAPTARAQLRDIQATLQENLGDELVGLYLHGSGAMGCFNPRRSDLDLLAVTHAGMIVETKRDLIARLLELSGRPHPVEISFLTLDQLHPWRYPTPYDLHYSEHWRAAMQAALAEGGWVGWNDQVRHDDDLAAHITVCRGRGMALQGPPPAEFFPEVPAGDYRASIMNDLGWARARSGTYPVYTALNACRVLAYALTGRVLSKAEGGEWALAVLPEAYRSLVQRALDCYRSEPGEIRLRPGELESLVGWIEERVRENR